MIANKIPAKISGKSFFITTTIVPSDIPLLLSKASMKKAKVSIDFQNDKFSIFDRKVDICFLSSGHYCIEIKNGNVDPLDVTSNVILFCKDLKLVS